MFPPKVKVSTPVRVPVAFGVNTTMRSHFWPPGTADEQLSVSEKSPVTDSSGDIGASPKLPTWPSTGALELATFWAGNAAAAGMASPTGAPKLGAILTKKLGPLLPLMPGLRSPIVLGVVGKLAKS
jgi:hypothetical protein